MLRRLLRGMKLLGYGCLLFLQHYAFIPRYLPDYRNTPSQSYREVWVVQNRFHSLFVLRRTDVQSISTESFPALTDSLPASPYLDIGWGEEYFFQAPEVGVGDALHAIFWRNPSVLRVSAFSTSFEERYGVGFRHVVLHLDSARYHLLLRSLQKQCEQPLRCTSAANVTRYYATRGWYYCLNNCNTWLLERCQDAGMPVPWRNTLLAEQVMEILRGSQ